MAGKRSYDDSCGVAQALNVIGERWALLVVRELLLGPKRFADLDRDLVGISKPVLSQRLDELEERGVVQRRSLDFPSSVHVYELTSWGYRLEPVILQVGYWGAQSPSFDAGHRVSATSAALSLRAMYDADRARDVSVVLELGRERFLAVVRSGELEGGGGFDIRRYPGGAVAADGSDVVVRAAPEVLLEVVYGMRSLEVAIGEGVVSLDGDRAAFDRFAGAFALPVVA